jgi:hypothetical protein
MMRYGEGYHGWTKGRPDDSALCSALDISVYAGLKLNLINGDGVEDTIAGVVKLIDNLPPGSYGLGLVRLSPVAKGPMMPERDVFLPCTDKSPMYTWGSPLENPTPQFVNPDAAARVDAALRRNPSVRIAQMFMDGPDHVHMHVWTARAR